jgi:hypothetical protein
MLDGLFVTPAVTAIVEALGTANAEGKIAVVGNAKLARALAAKRTVVPVALPPRAARGFPDALADTATLESGSLAAVVGVDIVDDDGWATTLREWSRVVRDGGAVVLVDKNHAPEASRRALCAGLTELEQRQAGRTVITSGLVSHLD